MLTSSFCWAVFFVFPFLSPHLRYLFSLSLSDSSSTGPDVLNRVHKAYSTEKATAPQSIVEGRDEEIQSPLLETGGEVGEFLSLPPSLSPFISVPLSMSHSSFALPFFPLRFPLCPSFFLALVLYYVRGRQSVWRCACLCWVDRQTVQVFTFVIRFSFVPSHNSYFVGCFFGTSSWTSLRSRITVTCCQAFWASSWVQIGRSFSPFYCWSTSFMEIDCWSKSLPSRQREYAFIASLFSLCLSLSLRVHLFLVSLPLSLSLCFSLFLLCALLFASFASLRCFIPFSSSCDVLSVYRCSFQMPSNDWVSLYRYVLQSVSLSRGSILQTGFLAVIIIYVFSVIAFLYLPLVREREIGKTVSVVASLLWLSLSLEKIPPFDWAFSFPSCGDSECVDNRSRSLWNSVWFSYHIFPFFLFFSVVSFFFLLLSFRFTLLSCLLSVSRPSGLRRSGRRVRLLLSRSLRSRSPLVRHSKRQWHFRRFIAVDGACSLPLDSDQFIYPLWTERKRERKRRKREKERRRRRRESKDKPENECESTSDRERKRYIPSNEI